MVASIGCLQHEPFLSRAVGPPAGACPLSLSCFKPASRALKPAVWGLTTFRCLSRCIQTQSRPRVSAGVAASAAPTMAVGVSQRMKELKDQGRCVYMPALTSRQSRMQMSCLPSLMTFSLLHARTFRLQARSMSRSFNRPLMSQGGFHSILGGGGSRSGDH